MAAPLVGIIMGSDSDWETLKHAADLLAAHGVAHETLVISAHRTPDRMFDYAKKAEARGLRVIIAGAGGAAHLPGMVAALTALPVLGVPVLSKALSGVDSLLSIVQMPAGIPVATFAIGPAGATNAAAFAMRMLAHGDAMIRAGLENYRAENEKRALDGSAAVEKHATKRTEKKAEKQAEKAEKAVDKTVEKTAEKTAGDKSNTADKKSEAKPKKK